MTLLSRFMASTAGRGNVCTENLIRVDGTLFRSGRPWRAIQLCGFRLRIIVKRRLPGRVRLTNHDRWFFIQL
jgi:hypothetical protein